MPCRYPCLHSTECSYLVFWLVNPTSLISAYAQLHLLDSGSLLGSAFPVLSPGNSLNEVNWHNQRAHLGSHLSRMTILHYLTSNDLKPTVSYVLSFFFLISARDSKSEAYNVSWPIILYLFNLRTTLELSIITSILHMRKLECRVNNLAHSSSLSFGDTADV